MQSRLPMPAPRRLERRSSSTSRRTPGGFQWRRIDLTEPDTLPEIVRLQPSYLQNQVVATSVQTKELCQLWAKVVRQTFEAINSAANKTFEQLQKAV